MPANRDCTETRKGLPVAVFNGMDDPINPYNGGVVELLGNTSRGEVMSTPDTIAYWVRLAGITSRPRPFSRTQTDDFARTAVKGARWVGDDGLEVRLYALEGYGHVWPSKLRRFPRIFGGSGEEISAAEEIVSFFKL